MKYVVIYFLLLVIFNGCMMMHNMNKMDNNHLNVEGFTDPVCGLQVDRDTAITLNHEGSIYYFDSEECLTVFQKNPEQFIKRDMKISNENNKKKMSGAVMMGVAAMAAMMILMMVVGVGH